MSAVLYRVKNSLLKVMYLGINYFYEKSANFLKLSLDSDRNARKRTFMHICGNGNYLLSVGFIVWM